MADQSHESRLAGIVERNARRTPGEWEADLHTVSGPFVGCVAECCYIEPRDGMELREGIAEANAAFIAHAPADITYLLARLAERDAENARLNAKCKQQQAEIMDLRTEIQRSINELE